MKAKVVRGNGFRGAIEYALGDEKTPEIVAGNMTGITPGQLAREFAIARQLRPDAKRPVWHTSLSLPVGERLETRHWEAVIHDFLDGMGLDRGNHQFFAVRHQDTDYDHVHIVASRIGLDSELWHGRWEARKAIELTQLLEKKHSLQQTQGYRSKTAKSLTRNEFNMEKRTGDESPRSKLQRLLAEAVKGRPTASQFAERLVASGVEVRANIARTGRMSGFSFAIDGIPFKASQLGKGKKGYGWNALQKHHGVVYDEGRDRDLLEEITEGKSRSTTCSSDGPYSLVSSEVAHEIPGWSQGQVVGLNSAYFVPRFDSQTSKSSELEADAEFETGRSEQLEPLRRITAKKELTPRNARKAIAEAILETPAPRAEESGLEQLIEWFSSLVVRLAKAIDVARDYWVHSSHDEVAQRGWSGLQMLDAGMEGPLVDRVEQGLANQSAGYSDIDLFGEESEDEGLRGPGL